MSASPLSGLTLPAADSDGLDLACLHVSEVEAVGRSAERMSSEVG
jgi:hypothetical protein